MDDLDRVYNTFSQDLRKSIQHIQLYNQHDLGGSAHGGNTADDNRSGSSPLTSCQTTPRDSPVPDADQKRLKSEVQLLSRMTTHYDAMAVIDCCRPDIILGVSAITFDANVKLNIPQSYFLDEPTSSKDDELGYRMLSSCVDYAHIPVGPFNHQGRAIFAAATRHFEDLTPDAAALLFTHPLDEAARRYLTRVGHILRSFRSWHVPATDPTLHLDYAPWIRRMVSVEDKAAEALSQLESGSQRRRTRNSQRAEVQNWLSLNATERNALTETSLESD